MPKLVESEIWCPIDGYEGRYEVSSNGRVRSMPRIIVQKDRSIYPCERRWKGKILQGDEKKDGGYPRVVLYKNGQRHRVFIHRLVCQAFLPNPDNKPFVNHIDGNPNNNCVANLEWCTHKENVRHAIEVLGHDFSEYTSKKIRCIETGKVYKSMTEASRQTGVNLGKICMVARGTRVTAGGYKWEYVNG